VLFMAAHWLRRSAKLGSRSSEFGWCDSPSCKGGI